MRSVCLIFPVLLSFACDQDPCRETGLVNADPVTVQVDRADLQLRDAESPEELQRFLKSRPALSKYFLHSEQYPNITILADRLFELVRNPSIDTLFTESEMAFDQTRFTADLSEGLTHLKGYLPATPVPRVQTIVTGFYNDLFISDTDIVVGLDYFIGDEATYRPNDIPQYILDRYTHEYLVATVLKFLISPKVPTSTESTLLSEMIDHGKVYYMLSRLLPCAPEHVIIGFSAEEMEEVLANQEIIWASLIENEVLYTTEEFMKVKFLGERPNVYEIGDKCPGRIGAWVGWQIVESFARKNSMSMNELISQTNHHDLFTKSGYKPRNR